MMDCTRAALGNDYRYAEQGVTTRETALSQIGDRLRALIGQLEYVSGETSSFVSRMKGPRPEVVSNSSAQSGPANGALDEIVTLIKSAEALSLNISGSVEHFRDIA